MASPPRSRNLSTSLNDCWELATALSRLGSLSNCPAEAIPVRSACRSPPRCNEASSLLGYGFEWTNERCDGSTGAKTPWMRGQRTRLRRTATRESHWGQGPQCLDPQAALVISMEHLAFRAGLRCVCQKWKTRLAEWTALQRQPLFVQHGLQLEASQFPMQHRILSATLSAAPKRLLKPSWASWSFGHGVLFIVCLIAQCIG